MSDTEEKEIISLEEIDRRYAELTAVLLDRIRKRDEMIALLKIAKPAKISAIREVAARFDKLIEMIEAELQSFVEMRRKRIEIDENYEKLDAMMEKMKPEFLAYIAEQKPEKLEEMKLLFSGEDSIQSH